MREVDEGPLHKTLRMLSRRSVKLRGSLRPWKEGVWYNKYDLVWGIVLYG